MRCKIDISKCVLSTAVSLIVVLLVSVNSSAVFAQAAPTAAEPKKELPPMEELTLKTKDDVVLHCTWYPGAEEKDSVPVLLLHGWKQDRQLYKEYGAALQKEKRFAVLIPDLRGHGESTLTGNDTKLDVNRFGKKQFATFYKDIEECGRFLQEKNNKGELNLEKLVIVAAEETCLLAMEYAIRDWSWPDFNNQKQGKFVKALVLMSPIKSFNGHSLSKMLREPIMSGKGARAMPIMVLSGSSDEKRLREAKAFHKLIENKRPIYKPQGATAAEKQKDYFDRQTVFFYQLPINGEGAALLAGNSKLPNMINFFVETKVGSKDEFAWQELPDR